MAASQKKQLINLLPQEEFAGSTLGRIIAWVLSTFRVIVVITEVVVMAAFLSRFYLDARMTDLNDEVKQKNAVLGAFTDFEEGFRDIQEKIKIASQLISEEQKAESYLQDISSATPGEINLSSYSVVANELIVKASSPTEFAISQFMANIKANDKFDKIELTQLSSNEAADQLTFSLNVTVAAGGAK
ncbi:PilN domain-containing protein [Candidatus Woesebacteria bacterium]|nr:PilN domain-containing protein [Candidatus Woesebacteria bacterium]